MCAVPSVASWVSRYRSERLEKTLTEFAALLVLPPGGPLVLLLIGLVLVAYGRRRPAAVACVTGFALLWISSLGGVGAFLARSLEAAPLDAARLSSIDAIVVLGGGLIVASPEYGADTVSEVTLTRVRYAARLARDTRSPVLVSGGQTGGASISEAAAMASTLEKDFGVRASWLEESSLSTAENAARTFAVLSAERKTRIALVTSASHMKRARAAFERTGFTVLEAPTDYVGRQRFSGAALIPSATGLMRTRDALREHLGFAWYALRGYTK